MKKILIVFLLLISNLGYSQRFKEVLMWQIETRAGGVLFGISDNQKDAELIIEDFQKRNADSKYDVSNYHPRFKYSSISVEKAHEQPVEDFKTIAKKAYKVLSAEDVKSMDIARKNGLEKGIDYYTQTRNVKRYYASRRISDLMNNYDKYIIKRAGSAL